MVNKRFAAVLALVLSSFGLVPVLGTTAASADEYTAGVRTSCDIVVPGVVRAGADVDITVKVRPNAPAQGDDRGAKPHGQVTVTVSKGGDSLFTRSVDYNGSAVTVPGPTLSEAGHYTVRAAFRTADGTVFKSCRASVGLDVNAGQLPNDDTPGPNPGIDNPGGLLPDTGGPHVMWLLLAVTLVGSGAALVYAARRRPRPSPYDI